MSVLRIASSEQHNAGEEPQDTRHNPQQSLPGPVLIRRTHVVPRFRCSAGGSPIFIVDSPPISYRAWAHGTFTSDRLNLSLRWSCLVSTLVSTWTLKSCPQQRK